MDQSFSNTRISPEYCYLKIVFPTVSLGECKKRIIPEHTLTERIDRQADEKLYQPKIHSQRIRELYILKVVTGLPMTVLVDQAIRDFIEKSEANQDVFYNKNDKGERTTERTG